MPYGQVAQLAERRSFLNVSRTFRGLLPWLLPLGRGRGRVGHLDEGLDHVTRVGWDPALPSMWFVTHGCQAADATLCAAGFAEMAHAEVPVSRARWIV